MIQFYLDNTLFDNPNNWEELTESISYSSEVSGYIIEIKGGVNFYGGAYAYLRSVFEAGICESIDVKILDSCADGNYKQIFEGLIFVSDIEWNLIKCTAAVQFVDNSYISKIYNNKGIECVLGVERSKNDVAITATAQTNISLLASGGGAGVANATGYRIFDAFEFLIKFMSDDTVGFVSDYFDPAGSGTDNTAKYSVIISGEEARTGTTVSFTPAQISFDDLYTDIGKLFNIAFSFEQINGVPTMRIEPRSYYLQTSEINYFENPEDLIQKVPQQNLYARVKFGSSQVVIPQPFLPDYNFFGTEQEEYHLLGTCNSEAVLDLRLTKLITDTNIIQDLVDNGTNDAYDKNNLLVVLNSGNLTQMTVKPGSGGTLFYYNDGVSNYRVAQYWNGNLGNSIAQYLQSLPDNFYAGYSSAQTITTTIPYGVTAVFNDDSTSPFEDPGGNYNNGTGRYTAPLAGVYTFNLHLVFNIVSPISPDIVRVYFLHYNAANVLISAVLKQTFQQPSGTTITADYSQSFSLANTDYVVVSIFGEGNIAIGSTYKSDAVQGDGIVQDYSFADFSILENSFEYNISCDKWSEIKSTPFKTFSIDYTDGQIKGWLNEMTRNISTGETNVIINSKPTA